ncbi:MAG: protease complex subunit PrcB family protein [Eubacteriales bacterium]
MNFTNAHKLFLIMMGITMLLTSCKGVIAEEEVENLKFIVISEECLTKELYELIQEHKHEEMKLTYSDEEYLYICRGYGERETGGYSIGINQLYATSNAIYLNTSLIGPSKEEQKNLAITYPYVVIRIENREQTVVFDS